MPNARSTKTEAFGAMQRSDPGAERPVPGVRGYHRFPVAVEMYGFSVAALAPR